MSDCTGADKHGDGDVKVHESECDELTLPSHPVPPSRASETDLRQFPWARIPVELQTMILEFVASRAALHQSNHKHDRAMARTPQKRKRDPSGRFLKIDPTANSYCWCDNYCYAAVCRDWQLFFERRNFARLVLQRQDIASFDTITKNRRHLVKHVWLHIRLPPYPCERPGGLEPEKIVASNSRAARAALVELFTVLAEWTKSEAANGGLILEISAYCPSDWRHHKGELAWLDPDYDPYSDVVRSSELGSSCGCQFMSLSIHHWARQTLDARLRVMGLPLDLQPNKRHKGPRPTDSKGRLLNDMLPEVAAVKQFLIRHQFHRTWTNPALGIILQALPALEEVRIEQWREIRTSRNQSWFSRPLRRGYLEHVMAQVDKAGIKKVSLWHRIDELFHREDHRLPLAVPRDGRALARYSRGLQHLAASLTTDAADFFWAFTPSTQSARICRPERGVVHIKPGVSRRARGAQNPSGRNGEIEDGEDGEDGEDDFSSENEDSEDDDGPVGPDGSNNGRCRCQAEWPHLETLILTSHRMQRDNTTTGINRLLFAAAQAAKKMPRLRLMELWAGLNISLAVIFRYEVVDAAATISWNALPRGPYHPAELSYNLANIKIEKLELDQTAHDETRVSDWALDAWREVALQNTWRPLTIKKEQIVKPAGMILELSAGQQLRLLKLKDMAIHPISARDLERGR